VKDSTYFWLLGAIAVVLLIISGLLEAGGH
jgi:hypothetical protein